MLRTLVVCLAVLAALAAPAAADDPNVIFATVGPTQMIVLSADGFYPREPFHPLDHAVVGTYDLKISDRSSAHNFHLVGPNYDQETTVDGVGDVDWTVPLVPGVYHFYCDPHPGEMSGYLVVSSPPPPATTTAATTTTTVAKPKPRKRKKR